jgi:hypothetical protein
MSRNRTGVWNTATLDIPRKDIAAMHVSRCEKNLPIKELVKIRDHAALVQATRFARHAPPMLVHGGF